MMKLRAIVVLLVVFLGIQSGCSLLPQQSGSTMDASQVQEAMVDHLTQKYGEEFVIGELRESPAHSALEAPNVWTLGAWPAWGTKYKESFQAVWRTPYPGGEDDITDSYLLIKMRSSFHDAIDEGLASVLDEFVAEYDLDASTVDVSTLPGTISQEEFLQWAAHNVTVKIRVAMPAEEGFTKGDLTSQVAPLSGSGNTFGAQSVQCEFYVYHEEGYQGVVSAWVKDGSARTEPGAILYSAGWDETWFYQAIDWGGG